MRGLRARLAAASACALVVVGIAATSADAAGAPPTVTINTPVNNADYYVGQDVKADYACADSDGTVSTCVGTVANGASIDTATAGAKSFTVTATDNDGNVTPRTVVYRVHTFVGACRATPLRIGPITVGEVNSPAIPCKTDQNRTVDVDARPLLRISALDAGTANGGLVTAAASNIADVQLNLGFLSVFITGIHSSVISRADSCESANAQGDSRVATITVNGKTYTIDDKQTTIPIPLLGSITLNQQLKLKGSVLQRAVFIDLPGTALDVAVGESFAGTSCAAV